MYLGNIFDKSLDCLIIFLKMFSDVYVFNFGEAQFINHFIYVWISLCNKKSLPPLRLHKFYGVFSCRNFIVLAFVCGSMIYLVCFYMA